MSDSRLGEPGSVSEERLQLALSLLKMASRVDDGRAALHRAYPSAPDAMIETATFHLYGDGPGAVVDYLAEAELLIRDPKHEIDSAAAIHLLYHVYNWEQFYPLLPDATGDLLIGLDDLKAAVDADDRESTLAAIEELRSILEGNRQAPEFD